MGSVRWTFVLPVFRGVHESIGIEFILKQNSNHIVYRFEWDKIITHKIIESDWENHKFID